MGQSHRSRFRLTAICVALAVMPITASFAIHRAATAQDENCYLVTSSGKRVGLGRLCGEEPPSLQLSGAKKDGIVRAKIKRRIAATPVIEVTFNGRQTYEMILDTGASGTLITREMARSLQIKPIGVVNAGIADGSTVQFSIGYVRSISVSGLTAKNLEVAIAPSMNVGLLGHDFFGSYDIKIKRDVIEFYPQSASE